MQKMGWFGVVRGAQFDRAHTTSCLNLIRKHASILYRYRDIASYLSKVAGFDPPTWRPAEGDPGRISRRSLASEN